jgi:hypothetical protein
MKPGVIAGSLLTGLLLTGPVSAQQVAAHIVVRGGPIAGHVTIADGYSTYRRPTVVEYRRPEPRRAVVVERYAPRVLVVERVRPHRHANYWVRHGYRTVTVFDVNGRYYDRDVRGLGRQVVVYERDGHYYRCDDRLR